MTDAPPLADDALLLRAILQNPADDNPRLQYADWLDEHGDEERAAFIRVQCELTPELLEHHGAGLHKDDGSEFSCRVCTLRRRERELIGKHGAEWAGPALPCKGQFRSGFVRGFVAEVRLSLAAFVGGPCGLCSDGWVWEDYLGGAGGQEWRTREVRCGHCRGKGIIPGIAADLFARQPVEVVRLVDRGPVPIHHSGGYRPLSWHNIPNRDDSGRLPEELMRLIAEADGWESYGPGPVASFDDADAADAALSAACVRYGRKKAGLED